MSNIRTIEEIQEDIRTLTRVPSMFIDAKLEELADEVGKKFSLKTGWINMPSDIGNFSDGYHTFNQLYHQRAMLFATIVKQNKDRAWKSHKHEDGELCFGGGWFLVTIDTPNGAYGYHYEDKYWDLFECEELPVAKHWDGYTEENVDRLFSL